MAPLIGKPGLREGRQIWFLLCCLLLFTSCSSATAPSHAQGNSPNGAKPAASSGLPATPPFVPAGSGPAGSLPTAQPATLGQGNHSLTLAVKGAYQLRFSQDSAGWRWISYDRWRTDGRGGSWQSLFTPEGQAIGEGVNGIPLTFPRYSFTKDAFSIRLAFSFEEAAVGKAPGLTNGVIAFTAYHNSRYVRYDLGYTPVANGTLPIGPFSRLVHTPSTNVAAPWTYRGSIVNYLKFREVDSPQDPLFAHSIVLNAPLGDQGITFGSTSTEQFISMGNVNGTTDESGATFQPVQAGLRSRMSLLLYLGAHTLADFVDGDVALDPYGTFLRPEQIPANPSIKWSEVPTQVASQFELLPQTQYGMSSYPKRGEYSWMTDFLAYRPLLLYYARTHDQAHLDILSKRLVDVLHAYHHPNGALYDRFLYTDFVPLGTPYRTGWSLSILVDAYQLTGKREFLDGLISFWQATLPMLKSSNYIVKEHYDLDKLTWTSPEPAYGATAMWATAFLKAYKATHNLALLDTAEQMLDRTNTLGHSDWRNMGIILDIPVAGFKADAFGRAAYADLLAFDITHKSGYRDMGLYWAKAGLSIMGLADEHFGDRQYDQPTTGIGWTYAGDGRTGDGANDATLETMANAEGILYAIPYAAPDERARLLLFARGIAKTHLQFAPAGYGRPDDPYPWLADEFHTVRRQATDTPALGSTVGIYMSGEPALEAQMFNPLFEEGTSGVTQVAPDWLNATLDYQRVYLDNSTTMPVQMHIAPPLPHPTHTYLVELDGKVLRSYSQTEKGTTPFTISVPPGLSVLRLVEQ